VVSTVRTTDCHAHILGREAMQRLARESPLVAPTIKSSGERDVLEIAGAVVQDPHPREIWDSDLRLRDMDAHGIDVQVLSPTVFTFFYGHESTLALACAMLQNEEIAAQVRKQPDRFIGLACVPLQDADKAADELRRSMTELGLRGAMIGSHVNGRNLDDPSLDPFWSAAETLGAFIFIHPHAPPATKRLKSYYLRNLVGLTLETTIAGASLVFGGVLERYPGLTICLSHGGGFVPYQSGRFVHGWEVRAEAKIHVTRSPEASFGKFYYDTILHSKSRLESLIGWVGAGHVLLGSDYPFDMGNMDCAARVKALNIAPDDRDHILGGYAAALLNARI
jgi:aminocarboxymuconate-semialdehyde decarboxylase